MSGKRSGKYELEARVEDTEQHLVRLRSTRRVETILSNKYAVSRRTVRRWIKKVHDRWEVESADEKMEIRRRLRTDYRKVLNEVLAAALNNQVTITDKDGNQRRVPAPNTGDALRAITQLRKLDGVDAQELAKLVEAKLDGNLGLSDLVSVLMEDSPDAS